MPAILFVPVALILNAAGMGFFASILWSFPITIGLIAFVMLLIAIGKSGTKDARNAAREKELQDLRDVATPIVNEHMQTLLRKRRTLVSGDEYGIRNEKKWRAEIDRFIEVIVIAGSSLRSDFRFRAGQVAIRSDLAFIVMDMVSTAQVDADLKFVKLFDKSMTPTEYEHFCAERLKAAGWKAVVTKASGDQGADVIATRGRQTVIVKCKHYAKPVGNKAVQEAAAAMRHYSGDLAVVVATNGFTKAAQALAASNGVLLLGHDDLTADWRMPA